MVAQDHDHLAEGDFIAEEVDFLIKVLRRHRFYRRAGMVVRCLQRGDRIFLAFHRLFQSPGIDPFRDVGAQQRGEEIIGPGHVQHRFFDRPHALRRAPAVFIRRNLLSQADQLIGREIINPQKIPGKLGYIFLAFPRRQRAEQRQQEQCGDYLQQTIGYITSMLDHGVISSYVGVNMSCKVLFRGVFVKTQSIL